MNLALFISFSLCFCGPFAAAHIGSNGLGPGFRRNKTKKLRGRFLSKTTRRGSRQRHKATHPPFLRGKTSAIFPQFERASFKMTDQTIDTTTENDRPTWPALVKGFRCRCPKCGEGKLLHGYLKVNDSCGNCGQELFHHRADDGPAYLTILFVGHLAGPRSARVLRALAPRAADHVPDLCHRLHGPVPVFVAPVERRRCGLSVGSAHARFRKSAMTRTNGSNGA